MLRSRWRKRIFFGLCALPLLGLAGVFLDRYISRRSGELHLATIVAHVEETDPRWRLEEIEADQPKIPDKENAALLVPKFKAALAGGKIDLKRSDGTYVYMDGPPNRVLNDEDMRIVIQSAQRHEA